MREQPVNPRLASLEEALNGGPIDDDRREANRRRWFADETSYQCSQCDHVFVDRDVVYREREPVDSPLALAGSWKLVTICDGCVRSRHPSWMENRHEPSPCEGGCGVFVSHWHSWRSSIRTCSPRCSERVRDARRHVTRQPRRCEVCEEIFEPARSDALYCSSACRQDAYRQRKAGRL